MTATLALEVNGQRREVTAGDDVPLLHVLRNDLGLTGTRFGCGSENCGACLVLVDGKPAYACTLPAASTVGRTITTIEGLGTPERPHPIQRAFLEEQAGQCGYCLSGIMISAKALLDTNPKPTRADIVAALDENLCRCGAHLRIVRAVERAAVLMASEART
jgi:nicotinate dehydrogenase subunit A